MDAPDAAVVFDQLCRRMDPELRAIAAGGQGLYFMDPEEVYNWLLYELWRACCTFDPAKGDRNLTIEKYWWSLWRNRKVKLLATFHTHRNQMVVTAEPVDEQSVSGVEYLPVPQCPVGGKLESRVWRLLAHGFPQTEICDLLGLHQRTLQDIMQVFRSSPEVWEVLTDHPVCISAQHTSGDRPHDH